MSNKKTKLTNNSAIDNYTFLLDLKDLNKARIKKQDNSENINEEENLKSLIKDFISDLKNLEELNYQAKVPEILIGGKLSPKFISGLISYLEEYVADEKKESKDTEKTQKVITKKEQKKIDEKWKEIEQVVNDSRKVSDISYLEIWKSIKKKILEGRIKIGKSVRDFVLEKVEQELVKEEAKEQEKLNEIKENTYYEQVKRYTSGFEFLTEELDIFMAANGRRKENRFTDIEYFDRFNNLVNLVKGNSRNNEYRSISKLLEENKVEGKDREILEGRLAVINRKMNIMPGEGR